MEVAKIFTDKVRSRLAELGWTHADLAKELGISGPSVSQTLTDGRAPRIDTLVKWASALEVSPSWLLGEQPGPSPASSDELEQFKQEVLIALLRASPAQWRALRPSFTAAFPELEAATVKKDKASG